MKIGVDISMLVYQGSGVAEYTYNLVKNLLRIDTQNEYHLFYSSLRRPKNFDYLDELAALGATVHNYYFPPRILKLWWSKWHILPVEIFIGRVDYFFSSDFLRPPLFRGTRGITTIHDLTWKLYPQYHTKDVIDAHEQKLRKTLKYQDTTITDSLSTKHDLLKLYPSVKTSNKIHVLYPGVGARFYPVTDKKLVDQVLKKYNIQGTKKYLLYVGAIEPRKNLTTAIRIFAELIRFKKYRDFSFIITGRAGWKNEEVFKLVTDLKLEEKVRFIGYVEDDDLPALYSGASILIYLSLYEGFGLPPLEAAKCGVPSLIYQNSSLNETFPGSYPFTKDGDELKTLIKILESRDSIDLSFAKKFSWDEYCRKFLSLLK